MSNVRMMRNTEKTLLCTHCGAPGNVVRESDDPAQKKLKCLRCNFMYTAADSEAAHAAGAIPDGPPPEPQPEERERNVRQVREDSTKRVDPLPEVSVTKIPRTPSYVFISKDRASSEFTTKKNVKAVALRWEYEGISYDMFELSLRRVNANIEIN